MRKLVLVAHNVRSAHNAGSLLRTADGLGVYKVYLTGYTPYPLAVHDSRLPHIARKAANAINKTALGAEDSVPWEHFDDLTECAALLKSRGFKIIALEQTPAAIAISDLNTDDDLALIVGNEKMGLPAEDLVLADQAVQIPMAGKKESFNVAVAAAMALYHLKSL